MEADLDAARQRARGEVCGGAGGGDCRAGDVEVAGFGGGWGEGEGLCGAMMKQGDRQVPPHSQFDRAYLRDNLVPNIDALSDAQPGKTSTLLGEGVEWL